MQKNILGFTLRQPPDHEPRHTVGARLLRGFIIGIVFLTLSSSLLLFLAFQPSEVPSLHASPAVIEAVRSKVEQAQTSAANGHPQTLSLDESELNSLIHSRLPRPNTKDPRQNRLRDLTVHLIGNQIGVHLDLQVYNQEMTIDIAGTLRTVNGYIQFEPTSGRIGRVPIPDSTLQAAIGQALASSASQRDLRLPTELMDVRVEQGRLVATYR